VAGEVTWGCLEGLLAGKSVRLGAALRFKKPGSRESRMRK
jgi:hypothetical protein